MNKVLIQELIEKALKQEITFLEILATLTKEGIESYHVDFLRNEEKLEAINRRVQAGQASYADFVREGTAAGCAYYVVYLNGRLIRYFGCGGGEHVQYFPGSR